MKDLGLILSSVFFFNSKEFRSDFKPCLTRKGM